MTDPTILQQAMRAVDTELNGESKADACGSLAANAVIKGAWIMHGRTIISPSDFKAIRLIQGGLMRLAHSDATSGEAEVFIRTEPSPVLDAMDQAMNDAEAVKLAAQ